MIESNNVNRDNKQTQFSRNWESVKVSFFPHVLTNSPSGVISLKKWIAGSELYNPLLNQVRNESNPDRQRKLKLRLPAITASGKFTTRKESNLIYHSGFIACDFDKTDPDRVKSILSGLPFVYFAGTSASGKGIWSLIRISEPEYHREHFEALKSDFSDLGLEMDPRCSDVCRLRIYSFDPDPLYNPDCMVYTRKEDVLTGIVKPPPPAMTPAPDQGNDWAKVTLLCQALEKSGTDITARYQDWLKVGGVLASLFGDHGRQFYHRISQFHPHYTPAMTDIQFNKCLRSDKYFGLGLLMHISKECGVLLKDIKKS